MKSFIVAADADLTCCAGKPLRRLPSLYGTSPIPSNDAIVVPVLPDVVFEEEASAVGGFEV